jgi:LytS/YehU family sensor histidine kinase
MKKSILFLFAFIICCIYTANSSVYPTSSNINIYSTICDPLSSFQINSEQFLSFSSFQKEKDISAFIPQKWFIMSALANFFVVIVIATISYRNRQRKKRINKIIQKNILWVDTHMEGNDIERENVIAQFDVLKNQMNPHFLFNSLNIISSLIRKDPSKAYFFTKEFSKLYRIVLDKKDVMFIKISEELDFISSYIYLQNIRFNENIRFSIKIPGENLSLMVPPFSLQILIENAIKHNIISAENPLKIDIYCDGAVLIVQNNLQRRTNQDPSLGKGYTNLLERYKLTSNETPEFYTDGVNYFARIPLLNN